LSERGSSNLWAYQAVEPQHLHRTTHRVALHSTPIAEDWAKRASIEQHEIRLVAADAF